MNAYVYFSCHQKRLFDCSWWIGKVSGSRLTHVCFGDDEVIVHPSYDGVRFWPAAVFDKFPGLVWKVTVPISKPANLKRYESFVGVKQSMVARILRWATRGMYPMMDCTGQAADMLDRCGIRVPRWVVSPAQLFRWLVSRGFHAERFVRA